MDNIIEPTFGFKFENLQLGVPITQPSSTYLTRIILNNKPLFIQASKCSTKNGFVKVGKKIYCDLMFSNEDTIMIDWMEHLENKCQELLLSKGEAWFQTEMTKEDIETSFTSPFKIYKSGKFYILRVNVKPNIKIFNETNTEVNLDDIKPEINMITILEIQGIKFTSRNFQIEIELKQSMIVSPDPFLDSCFIKKDTDKTVLQEDNISQIVNKILQTRQTTLVKPNELSNNSEISEKPIILTPIIIEDVSDLAKVNDSDTGLMEFDLNVDTTNLEPIILKKPNHTYYVLYREAIDKAKKLKAESKTAYSEARNIKDKYMLDIESDNDSNSDFDSDTDF